MPQPAESGRGGDRDEDRLRRLAALRARLREEAMSVRTPADWARCLRVAALMPEEEFANVLLISAQQPGATKVKDYRHWASMGRQVRRGEKGIEVFAGLRLREQGDKEDASRDGTEPGWRDGRRVSYVWDLAQTTGKALAVTPGLPAGPVPERLLDALRWLARREGFAVEHERGAPADGTTFWAARRIRLLPGLDDDHAVWALAHQLGHILLEHGNGLPPGMTTSGCAGVGKAEADSIAFIVAARHGIAPAGELAHPVSWAGRDPRAQPAAAILAEGQRITAAAARITRHTGRLLHGDDPAPALVRRAAPAARPRNSPRAASPPRADAAPRPSAAIQHVLQHAQDFYTAQLAASWVPAYLDSRGISSAVATEWVIGHAPPGWTALTDHLRGIGHADDEIEAAGVARTSSRGVLIDRFRDRVMLPVHDEGGRLAGFIGRAHPDAPDSVPRYLNSPETAGYQKGSLLFGLARARPALAEGAIPVIVEGPFDAIAVALADPGRHAGLAPCGTALTIRQAELISQDADLPRTGILVAFDADRAGRNAAIRTYDILRPHTPRLLAVLLSAKDPATVLQKDGPQALRAALRANHDPLSAMVIDARIEEWGKYLDDTEGRHRAMHSTAALVAELLPSETAAQVNQITAGRELTLVDDMLRHVDNPELRQIAHVLPADAAYQVTRAANSLGFDASEVLAAVANAVTRRSRSPKGQLRALRDDPARLRPGRSRSVPALASVSFPDPPLPHAAAAPAPPTLRTEPAAGRPRPARRGSG